MLSHNVTYQNSYADLLSMYLAVGSSLYIDYRAGTGKM